MAAKGAYRDCYGIETLKGGGGLGMLVSSQWIEWQRGRSERGGKKRICMSDIGGDEVLQESPKK